MSTAGLKHPDHIEVDHLGRRFYAEVRFVDPQDGLIHFRPLDRNITWRSCTSREIIGIWRASKHTRARFAPEAAHASAA